MSVHVHISSLTLLKNFQLNSLYRVCDSKLIDYLRFNFNFVGAL